MSRGPHPDDRVLFSPAQLPALRRAAEEVSWLMGRGYAVSTAVAAAGNHHQLTLRQRVALSRACCSEADLHSRRARLRGATEARGRLLRIDGFNLLIALEVALGGGILVRGREGALRDLAGLRGSYHLIPETSAALECLGRYLAAVAPARTEFLLDRPVSNSGRLRALIEEHAARWAWSTGVELVADPDPVLARESWVVSADALILDRCGEWVNLASEVIAQHAPEAWIVDLAV